MCPNAEFIMDGNYICKLDGSPCDSDASGDCYKTTEDNEKREREFTKPKKWIEIDWRTWKCPECNTKHSLIDIDENKYIFNFCPTCGKKNGKPEENNELY